MAYSIDQDQIIQEVTLAAESHPQLAIAENKENLLITLCNWYDAYDRLDPTTDLANWTVMSRAEYDALDIHPQCRIEDQTHVFLDKSQAMIHKLQKVVDELGLDYHGWNNLLSVIWITLNSYRGW